MCFSLRTNFVGTVTWVCHAANRLQQEKQQRSKRCCLDMSHSCEEICVSGGRSRLRKRGRGGGERMQASMATTALENC